MNKLYWLLLSAMLVLVLPGCDNKDDGDGPVLDHFEFQAKEASLPENGSAEIAVYWHKANLNKSGYVTLRISNMGFPSKAYEGVDFNLSTEKIEFEAGEYVKTFTVTGIDNDRWQPDRKFFVEFDETDTDSKLKGDSDLYNSQINVTVRDDDDFPDQNTFTVSGKRIQDGNHVSISTPMVESGDNRGLFSFFSNYQIDSHKANLLVSIDEQRNAEGAGTGYSLHVALPQVSETDNGADYGWVPIRIKDGQAEYLPGDYYFNLQSDYSPMRFTMPAESQIGMAYARIDSETGELIHIYPEISFRPGTLVITNN